MHNLEMARKKAQNDANFLGEDCFIYVYNDKCEGMKGHHLVVHGKMKEMEDMLDDVDFVEEVKPNGEAVIFC